MRDQDRFRGCLIGGAAGDALGYAIEFSRERQIFDKYGEEGITAYKLTGGKAEISDDTQMTLFTAAGLLVAAAQGSDSYAEHIHLSYLDWLATQEKTYPLPEGKYSSWLAGVPGLFSRRAPGTTCMSALECGRRGTIDNPLNKSKGCGGVMRVAPVGLYFNDRNMDVKEIARIGAEAAAVTHGHPLGWMPAAALAQIVHEISQDGTGIPEAIRHAMHTLNELWPETEEKAYLLWLMRRAVDLTASDTDSLDAIHKLGEGWVAEETLAIAIYCALKYENDFDKALIAAVNHNGDSDSTGAVTGNILGAKLGLSGIPEKYKQDLELKDVILEVADDLWKDERKTDPARAKKYGK